MFDAWGSRGMMTDGTEESTTESVGCVSDRLLAPVRRCDRLERTAGFRRVRCQATVCQQGLGRVRRGMPRALVPVAGAAGAP
jgi:hypothetical protein